MRNCNTLLLGAEILSNDHFADVNKMVEIKGMDMSDNVNHPKHYTSHPSGVECIQVTEHMSFNLGNVVKYLWRADEKGAPLEDLKKARWYLDREIQKRESGGL